MAKAPICWMPAGRSRKPAAAVTTAKMKNAKLSMVFSPAYSKVRKSSKMHAAMLKRSKAAAGTVVVLEHSSEVLKDNPWGDPHVRKLAVWLPPEYDGASLRRFPVLYDMTGFTGSGLAHIGWKSFGNNIPERAARLIY